jgi:sulfate permease, SulP family
MRSWPSWPCLPWSTAPWPMASSEGGHDSFWERSGHFFSHLEETTAASLVIGLAALVVLVLGKVFLKNRPVALFVVIGGIAAASFAELEARDVMLLGEVPQGLPAIGLPAIHWNDLHDLLPLAIVCLLLGVVETAAIGRMFTAKHGGRLNANQEFLALAGANLAVALEWVFPVSGGMSQSLVNDSGGAHTAVGLRRIVGDAHGGSVSLRPAPLSATAGAVSNRVGGRHGMFQVSALAHLRRINRTEYVVAAAVLLGVLSSGLLRGVLIGAIISLVLLIQCASRPHLAYPGRIPGNTPVLGP